MALTSIAILISACASPMAHDTFADWPRADRIDFATAHRDPQAAARRLEAGQRGDDLPSEATLAQLIGYAMRHHPSLEAAFYRWRAAAEQIPQARSMPDPMLSFGLLLDQVERDADYMGERYMISQVFPWFGTLERRGDVATAQAHAQAQAFEAERLMLAADVTQAYAEYVFLYEAIAVTRENLALLERLETVARSQYRTGAGGATDMNRAQVEIGRLEDRMHSLTDMIGLSMAELNETLGRSVHAPLPSLAMDLMENDAALLPERSDSQWLALARHHNPAVAAMRHEAAAQRHEIALASKAYYPDLQAGLEYGRNASGRMAMMDGGGKDMIFGFVSINVPIWRSRLDAASRQSLARFGQATLQVQTEENRLDTRLKRALYNYRNSQRQLALYDGTLLPKAEQSLASTETAYRAGQAGFSDLIDAQRVLLEFELARQRAAADRLQWASQIRALAGPQEMDALPDRQSSAPSDTHEHERSVP